MRDLIAKLRETLYDPLTRDEMRRQMQALLHEFPLAKEERGLERPPSRTLDSLYLQPKEDEKGICMMYATLDDIDCDLACDQLYKEKTMSSDSEAASPPRWAQRSLRSKSKQHPTHSPRHESAKWGNQVRGMQKWRQSLISPASSLMLLPQDPIPFLHEEDEPSSSK